MPGKQVALRVLFFPSTDTPDQWVAQALERDIVAYGPDVESAKRAFEKTVAGYIQLAIKHHQEPLQALQPAAAVFFEVWTRLAEAKANVEFTRMPTIPAFMMPVVTHEQISA